MIAAHSLIMVPGGTFLPMTDPPEWAATQVSKCVNTGTWPVLAGPEGCRDLLLSSPVILYDHAEVAQESAGDLFDATEIDEILTSRTLALTDAEKQAARGTDVRAAELMDRLETMPTEIFERMHGAIRYLKAQSRQIPVFRPRRDRADRHRQPDPMPVRGGTLMIGKLIKAAIVATVLAMIVQSLPDIKRYLELRDM